MSWPIVELDEVVTFLDHIRKPVKKSDRREGPYPYYGANGQQGTIDGFIFDEPLVLLAEDGGHFDNPERGVAYRVEGKCWVNNHAHVLRANGRTTSEYLAAVLRNLPLKRYITGTTRAKLTKAAAKRIEIPLPPLDEQRQIAGILDAADTLRRRRREALALLDTLPGAIFAEMFGDVSHLPSVRFGDVVLDVGNGVSPSRSGSIEDEVLTLSAITGLSFDASKRKKDKFSSAIPDGKRVEIGDFLLCRGNGNPDLVGSGKIADEAGRGIVYPDTVIRVKLDNDRVIPGYIASLWKHRHIRNQITAGARTTNGTMKINQATVKSIEIPLPDLKSQTEFARQLEAIDNSIKSQQAAHLSELETLFASLQSRAFAGEL